jgi:hypothetical protein
VALVTEQHPGARTQASPSTLRDRRPVKQSNQHTSSRVRRRHFTRRRRAGCPGAPADWHHRSVGATPTRSRYPHSCRAQKGTTCRRASPWAPKSPFWHSQAAGISPSSGQTYIDANNRSRPNVSERTIGAIPPNRSVKGGRAEQGPRTGVGCRPLGALRRCGGQKRICCAVCPAWGPS